ncbi:hypothetical protein ACIPVK_01070 [Paeniglutamicibacter sp. MACA_103]|uniref:hypothetical protein n=1 Tax=Paeniglutamicibacter sp. MACA_103 TaxID=3377337 RepID=UPI00389502ED
MIRLDKDSRPGLPRRPGTNHSFWLARLVFTGTLLAHLANDFTAESAPKSLVDDLRAVESASPDWGTGALLLLLHLLIDAHLRRRHARNLPAGRRRPFGRAGARGTPGTGPRKERNAVGPSLRDEIDALEADELIDVIDLGRAGEQGSALRTRGWMSRYFADSAAAARTPHHGSRGRWHPAAFGYWISLSGGLIRNCLAGSTDRTPSTPPSVVRFASSARPRIWPRVPSTLSTFRPADSSIEATSSTRSRYWLCTVTM